MSGNDDALVQTRRRRKRGRALAIGALTASAVWLAALAVAFVLVRGGNGDRAASDPVTKDGEPRVSTFKAGDCFTGFVAGMTRIFAREASCTQPHGGEIGARITLPTAPYPGDASLTATAVERCRNRVTALYKEGRGDEFTIHVDRPDRRAWEHGDHAVVCALRYPQDMADILRKQPKYISSIVPGDCIRTWDGGGNEAIVDCDEKHEVQVYAVIEFHGETYPTMKQVVTGCTERAARVFGKHPPDVLERFTPTRKDQWTMGQRFVFCLVAARHGTLTRSVMPK